MHGRRKAWRCKLAPFHHQKQLHREVHRKVVALLAVQLQRNPAQLAMYMSVPSEV
jgi:hypothetical protein